MTESGSVDVVSEQAFARKVTSETDISDEDP